MELVQPSDVNKNLLVLPGGAVPPNPTELLARNGLDKAIELSLIHISTTACQTYVPVLVVVR